MRTRAKAERADSVRHGNWRTSVARNRALIRLFFRSGEDRPVSIRERDDQIVSDRFDPIGGEGELRGQFLRLARLEIPRAVAILARNQELLAVHKAVGEHGPLVRARGIDAKEAVTQSHDEDVVPHDLEVLLPAVRDVVGLAQMTSVSIGRGEPPPGLKSLEPHAAFRRRGNAKRRRSRLDAGAGGGVDDTRRTMPSTPWM